MNFTFGLQEQGVPGDFDSVYLSFCAKHAGGESLDKDYYEYVCDSILAENEISQRYVAETVQSFYPDFIIDSDDVAAFARAAQDLFAIRNPTVSKWPEEATSEYATVLQDTPQEPAVTREIWTEHNVEDISYVCSIFPNIQISLIEYVYMAKCARNKDPTIEFLLEHCADDEGIERLRNKMVERLEKEEKEIARANEEAKKMRAVLFQKYGDRAVLNSGTGKEPKKDEKVNLVLENPISGTSAKPSKIRYRDGVIATYSGEKVILTKNPADDYDGGSRGKVKSKGKRGPGFY